MLTQSWTQLRLHKQQAAMWRTKARYIAAACGRGSGKTELARRRVVRYLPVRKPWPDPMYFYALPTFAQAKRVAWRPLKQLIPKHWIRSINESEMRIDTVFGSSLSVLGLDKPQRAEGVQWDGGVIDESSDQRPNVFNLTFLPTFSHRHAWCWRIGVPKRYGVGAREFKSVCEKYDDPDDPDTAFFAWPSSDILTPEQIAWALENLDPRDYGEQYEANWEEAGGRIFYASSKANVTHAAQYKPDRAIVVGSDFNVNPMCWVLGHLADNGLVIFDELFVRNTNTQETLNLLYRKYGRHEAGWEFYGDASGRARKTSASVSDYLQIRNDDRFSQRRVYYPKANPQLVDRFAACNTLFRSAAGEHRCFINPRCKRLIRDIEDRAYKESSREPDDYGDMGHITDALGYIVHRRFPVALKSYDKAMEVFSS